MEKYGVSKEHLLEDLRNEESKLMTEKMGSLQKKASNTSGLDARLQQVREKITELDLGKGEETPE